MLVRQASTTALLLLEPREVAGLGHVAARGENPIAELLHGHVAEAAGQVGQLVAAAALGREVVVRAHIVAEAEAAGLGVVGAVELCLVGRRRGLRGIDLQRVGRRREIGFVDLHLVGVAIAANKVVEQVADQPGIVIELPEHMIDGKVERVHHAVLALVDDPERLAFHFEQLRAAVVAVGGVRDQEALIVRDCGVVQFAVERLCRRNDLAGVVERSLQHIAPGL